MSFNYGIRIIECKYCKQQAIHNNLHVDFCSLKCHNKYHTGNTCKICHARIEVGKTQCNTCSPYRTSKNTYNIPYHVAPKNNHVVPQNNCYVIPQYNCYDHAPNVLISTYGRSPVVMPRIVPPTTNYMYGNGNGQFNDVIQSSTGPFYFYNADKNR